MHAGIETLAPALLGLDPGDIDHLNAVMDVTLPGHPYMKSAIDIAAWDIFGQTARMPVWQCFGGNGGLRRECHVRCEPRLAARNRH